MYGLDWKARNLWQITGAGALNLLSTTKYVSSQLKAFIDGFTQHSDGSETFPDVPYQVTNGKLGKGRGISFGYNRKYDEVYFSILGGDNLTMAFSERVGAFYPGPEFHSPCYILNNEDFFSCDPLTYTDVAGVQFFQHNNFFLHDQLTSWNGVQNYLRYYNALYVAEWIFVVNLEPEEIKVFDYMHIGCGQERFKEVLYETEFQAATQSPFEDLSIGFKPRYQEDAWKVPIKRCDTLNSPSSHYLVGSPLRGKWMKVTLRYDPTTPFQGAIDRPRQYIKSVETYLKKAYV
jgi:hypothetical protein